MTDTTRPRRRPLWFFDLDDTLHDASHAIFGEIDRRMTAYVARHLSLSPAEADALRSEYWRRYGATMLGLVRHHRIDAHHFLHHTHDFDAAALVRAERRVGAQLARLPGRKLLLTNAPGHYASAVLLAIGAQRAWHGRYAIEQMRVHGAWRPKPSRALLRRLLARERCAPGAAVLVDDSARNLRAARTVGMRTVLFAGHGPAASARRGSGGPRAYVDLRVHRLSELARGLHRLQRCGGASPWQPPTGDDRCR